MNAISSTSCSRHSLPQRPAATYKPSASPRPRLLCDLSRNSGSTSSSASRAARCCRAYDPLYGSARARHHILVRHEQGAGHAAEGYALATGRVGGLHRDVRPGRHQPGHRDRRRLHGLGADGRDHRPGGLLAPHGHRRLPGGRHPRHHDADHQAHLPRDRRRGDSPGASRRPSTSPPPAARPRARRHHQGRAAGRARSTLAAGAGPARLPAGHDRRTASRSGGRRD